MAESPAHRPAAVDPQGGASHLEAIAAATDDLLSWCEADVRAGTPVDLHALSMRYALSTLGPSVFGEDIVQAAPTLREVLPPLGDQLKRRSLAPVRSPHWFPSPANRRGERLRKVVWDPADSLIAERRATATEGTDLLSRLLRARNPDTGEALSEPTCVTR